MSEEENMVCEFVDYPQFDKGDWLLFAFLLTVVAMVIAIIVLALYLLVGYYAVIPGIGLVTWFEHKFRFAKGP